MCVSFSWTDSGLCKHHLFIWSNVNFCHNYYYYYCCYYYYYYYYLLLESFSRQFKLMVFHLSLSDSKSSQVSRTLLGILAVLNNVVVWMVSTRPPTSKSSNSFNNPLVTVPKAPITIGIIVTFMFHSFFNSLPRSRYLSFFSYKVDNFHIKSFHIKSIILQVLFLLLLLLLLLFIIRYGLLVEIR